MPDNNPSPPKRMKVSGFSFELRKQGVARFDWRDPYHIAVTLSWPGFIGVAFAFLVVINLIFAELYLAQPGAVQNLARGAHLNAFFFSLETLSTVGYGEMAPATFYGHLIASAEIVIGMAFTAILTGIMFVRFSRPQAKILFADKAVIAKHNGAPALMVRIANGRLSVMTRASAEIGIFLGEITAEGNSFRRVVDLLLVQDRTPIFPLTWTLMHMIDDNSPLKDLGSAELREQGIRLYVSVEALDSSLGARVHAIHEYDDDHIAPGMRYSEAVTRDEQGATADITRLSLIEAEPT